MTYEETTEYLYNSTPVFEHVGASAYKEGLSTTLALDEYLQEVMVRVHVLTHWQQYCKLMVIKLDFTQVLTLLILESA